MGFDRHDIEMMLAEKIQGDELVLKTNETSRHVISIDDFVARFGDADLNKTSLTQHPKATGIWKLHFQELFKSSKSI